MLAEFNRHVIRSLTGCAQAKCCDQELLPTRELLAKVTVINTRRRLVRLWRAQLTPLAAVKTYICSGESVEQIPKAER